MLKAHLRFDGGHNGHWQFHFPNELDSSIPVTDTATLAGSISAWGFAGFRPVDAFKVNRTLRLALRAGVSL